MQTRLDTALLASAQGQAAEAILRRCVHCGFCNATCPTYQLRGDELDGPRGRIYLIKEMLENREAGPGTRLHLDRCLTCRACETTCPSGVEFGRLLDIGRQAVEQRSSRPMPQRTLRWLLRSVLTRPRLFGALLGMGRLARPWLPSTLARRIPVRQTVAPWPPARHARRMLVLEGCVQPALAPSINTRAAQVLDRLGISLIRAERAGCCGAISQHLAAPEEARQFMRRNIDAWWPYLEAGAEAIVTTASGCGVQIREYGHLLQDDAAYAQKASQVSALARDIAEVLRDEDVTALRGRRRRVACHVPCTLQHGQRLAGLMEAVLNHLGHELVPVADAHLCCGAAGTYALLQPALSGQLRENKLAALQAEQPEVIVTANIGCLLHLAERSDVPVMHWLELVD